MIAAARDRRIHALLIAGILLNLVALAICAAETSRSALPQLSTPSEVDPTACLSAEQIGKKVVVEQFSKTCSTLYSAPLGGDLTKGHLHYAHDVSVPLGRIDCTLQSCSIRFQV